VCISAKRGRITPSPGLSLQNPEAILWEEKYASDATRGNFMCRLFRGLGQRNERGDLVVDVAGKENTKVARRISIQQMRQSENMAIKVTHCNFTLS